MKRHFGRLVGGFIVCVAACLASTPTRADVVSVELSTIATSRVEARDGVTYRSSPFLQTISLRGRPSDISLVSDLEMEVSGWGELTLGDTRGEQRVLSDLDLAYAGGKIIDQRVQLRLGRHLVTPGAARVLHLDGLSAEVRIFRGLGFSVYAGLPVAPRFAERVVDFSVGGRVHYRLALASEVGVSIESLLGNHGGLDRREVGVDGRTRLGDHLAAVGLARYNVSEARLAQANLGLSALPFSGMDITLEYRRIAPDLFLPRYSIFSVFSQESRDEIGGFVGYSPVRWLSLQGSFHNSHTTLGWGTDSMAKLTLKPHHRGTTRFGLEGRRLHAPSNGYLMGRAFLRQRITSVWSMSATGSLYNFDLAVNGQSRTIEGALSLVGDITRDWRIAVTGTAGSSPYLRDQRSIMAKLVYGGGRVTLEERR